MTEKLKEAMKILKDFHDKSALFSVRTALDTVLPELKESEDERIKKEFCKDIWTFIPNEKAHKYIAWLEKQGEEKSIDMSIKEKAHQIAWETSKHYDPLLSKESWCEMAALDMASWLEKQGEEDETGLTNTMIMIKECAANHYTKDSITLVIDWLESLKQRLKK